MKKKRNTKSKGKFVDVLIAIICAAGIGTALFYLYKDFTASLANENAEPVGIIYFKKNSAQRRFENRNLWERLKTSAPIYDGDRIRTGAVSEAYAMLDNGSRIEIHENTLIQIFTGQNSSVHFSNGSISVVSSAEDAMEITSGDKKILLSQNSEAIISMPAAKDDGEEQKNGKKNIQPKKIEAAIEVSAGQAEIRENPVKKDENVISKITSVFTPKKSENVSNTQTLEPKIIQSVKAGETVSFNATVLPTNIEESSQIVNPIKAIVETVKNIPHEENDKNDSDKNSDSDSNFDNISSDDSGFSVLLPPSYYTAVLTQKDNFITFCWKNAPSIYVEISAEPTFNEFIDYSALFSDDGVAKYKLPSKLENDVIYWRVSSSTSSNNFVSGILNVRYEDVKPASVEYSYSDDVVKTKLEQRIEEEKRLAEEEKNIAENRKRAAEEARRAENLRNLEEGTTVVYDDFSADDSLSTEKSDSKDDLLIQEEMRRAAEEKRRIQEEARLAEEKLKAEEEARIAEEKRKAAEEARIAEEKRRAEEEAARIAEEKRKAEEAARIAKRKREAEERARKLEEKRKSEEAARIAEEKRKSEEAARIAKEKHEAEERARKLEEKRKAEEAARIAEEKRKSEEAARIAEEKRKSEEAARIAEEKRKTEEAARLAEEKRKSEEAARIAEEKRKSEEAARIAEEKRKSEEAARIAEEKRKAEEAARIAEEKRKSEEAARIAEEKRKSEEAARLAEEKRKAEEAARIAEEKRKAAEEARIAEERRKAEEAARLAEEKRKSEEEARIAEEKRKAEEAARIAEERRIATEEARLAEEKRNAAKESVVTENKEENTLTLSEKRKRAEEQAAKAAEEKKKSENSAALAEKRRKTEEEAVAMAEKRKAEEVIEAAKYAAEYTAKVESTSSVSGDAEYSEPAGEYVSSSISGLSPVLNFPEQGRLFKDEYFKSLKKPCITFTWEPIPGASYYEFELKTQDGKLLLRKNETGSSYVLEKNISLISDSGAYIWSVTAKTKVGSNLSSSKTASRKFLIKLEDVKATSVNKTNLILEK